MPWDLSDKSTSYMYDNSCAAGNQDHCQVLAPKPLLYVCRVWEVILPPVVDGREVTVAGGGIGLLNLLVLHSVRHLRVF
eukprot:SAG22_NODE_769_length_7337_cov_15.897624_5_plen_79_part_00